MRAAIWRVSDSAAAPLSPTMRGQSTTTPPATPVERLISGASPDACEATVVAGGLGEGEAAGLDATSFGSEAGAPPHPWRPTTASMNGPSCLQATTLVRGHPSRHGGANRSIVA